MALHRPARLGLSSAVALFPPATPPHAVSQMPRKKGHRSGTPDGYAPSPLGEPPRGRPGTPGQAGQDAPPRTPLRHDDATRGGGGGGLSSSMRQTRGATDGSPSLHLDGSPAGPSSIPSWGGLGWEMPGTEPRGAVLEPNPVATGIGANVHALLSPKLMVVSGLGAGDWVAVSVVGRGAGDGTDGAGGIMATPEPPSSSVEAGGDAFGSPARPSPPPSKSKPIVGSSKQAPVPGAEAPALLLTALITRHVALDAPPSEYNAATASPSSRAHVISGHPESPPTSPSSSSLGAGARALGHYLVLAQVHPNPKATSACGVSLARKVWMSLGSPPGGTAMHVYALNGPKVTGGTSPTRVETDQPPRGGVRAPAAGAQCASTSLRLWAMEEGKGGASSSAAWLERGLGSGGSNPGGGTGPGPKQLAVLEALARRALKGRALLPGNLARLPLLGASAYFQVEDVRGDDGGVIGGCGVVGEATAIKLLPRHRDGVGSIHAAGDDGDDASTDAEISDEDAAADDDGKDPGTSGAARALRAARRIGGGGNRTNAPTNGFGQLGGVGEHAEALRELVELPLRRPELFERCGVKPPRGVLLWGPPGTGKTRLARAAAVMAGAQLMVVRGPELIGAHVGESEAALRGVFVAASAAAPCVVLLDELDAIAPARSGGDGLGGRGGDGSAGEGADEAMSARVVAALLSILDGVGGGDGGGDAVSLHRVVVVATTNRPEAVDRALRRPGRFDREIEVGVPTPGGRREILATHLRRVRHRLTPEEVDELAAGAHGFVGADIAALCQAAAMTALRRCVDEKTGVHGIGEGGASPLHQEEFDADALASGLSAVSLDGSPGVSSAGDGRTRVCRPVVTWKDFVAARAQVRPSALREVGVEVPKVAWDDVGGLGDVKRRLQEAVEWSERHPEAMARMGAKPPKGILLYGPPGCSKTMLARAVASASGRNFLTVKGPELYSKWVGDSEKAVRALFARARTSAPSVIFLDELDGLVGQRSVGGDGGGGEPSVHDRLLTQLLAEMDGLQAGAGGKADSVAVVAATNRPDLVDPALLRPGRFDRLLYIPPPDSAEDRLEILKTRLRKTPIGDDVDLRMLAASMGGYTGADMTAVCREAALAALEEDLGSKVVCARHFAVAAGRVPPSPPPPAALAETYARFMRPGAGLTAV